MVSDEEQEDYSKAMMRPYLFVVCLFFMAQAGGRSTLQECSQVLNNCELKNNMPRCVEESMRNCVNRKRWYNPNWKMMTCNSSHVARMDTEHGHVIHIPSEALLRSIGAQPNISSYDVDLKVFVLNSSIFKVSSANESVKENKVIKIREVLGVWLGKKPVQNLSHPVTMTFTRSNQSENGECVFWKHSTGNWSTDGCSTTRNSTHFVCHCNHLSFFAVLISPGSVPDPEDIWRLTYITYIGSSFSVVFTVTIIVLFLRQRRKKTEHSVIIHTELAGALFLLHLFFLISAIWSGTERVVCQFLGLILHWALLATFTWMAIEGFHLYLLIVRVFNIYIRRYLLKLNLVGWGIPTIIVIICGAAGIYGKHTIVESASNGTSICWVTSKAVSRTTVNGYLGLVLLFNSTILTVMLVKLHQLRARNVQGRMKVKKIWKDWATILGLGWILGLPWGLAFGTYGPLSLLGIYIFTILNAFQGVLMFLWFLSIICQSNHEEHHSTKAISMSNLSS